MVSDPWINAVGFVAVMELEAACTGLGLKRQIVYRTQLAAKRSWTGLHGQIVYSGLLAAD